MSTQKEKVVFSILPLKRFVLQVEMEKKLYEKTMKILLIDARDIRDKYRHALDINNFLSRLSSMNNIDEMQSSYQDFCAQKIDDKLCYGDIFTLDEEALQQGKIFYSIRSDKINADYYHPEIGMNKYYQIAEALKGVGEKVITNSIQAFEKCFEKILSYLIKTKPEAYLFGKNIEYTKLINCDVEELKEMLIRQEIDKLMYSVSDTIKKLNENHSWHLDKHRELWDEFIEVDLHRNIIVHNNGVINNEYLNKVPQQYKNQEKDAYIKCNKPCVEKKTNTLLKFAFLLYYLVANASADLDALDNVAFNILKDENWDVAQYAYLLLYNTKKLDLVRKTNYQLNYLNAKKHLLGKESVLKEIMDVDVGGMKDMYTVAKKLLLEDYDNITEELEKCYPGDFNSYYIETWPIFIEYRKSKEYLIFREKHKEDFEQYEYSSKNLDEV